MGSGNERGEQWEPTAGLTCSTTKSLCSSGMTTSSSLDIDIRKSIGQDVRKARSSFSHSVLPLILLFLFSNAKCSVYTYSGGTQRNFIFKINFYQSTVELQYSFSCMAKWISHTHTHTHTHTHIYIYTHMYIHSFLDSFLM